MNKIWVMLEIIKEKHNPSIQHEDDIDEELFKKH